MVMAFQDACRKGFRSLPATLDWNGTHTPDRVYVSLPRTRDIADGFIDITNGEILRLVDTFAWKITERHGLSDRFETVAYVGISDPRYAVVFFAAVKCGYKVLFISPRNPIHQNVSLLQQTECSKVFYSEEMAQLVSDLQTEVGEDSLLVESVKPLGQWADLDPRPYPYRKSFEEARYDPVVILHSSGSTGAPRPIVQTHQFFANLDRPLPPIEDREMGGPPLFDFGGGGYYFSPFPCYHLAGFHSLCFYPVFGRSGSLVMGYADQPATSEMVLQVMKAKRVRILYAPPSIIEGLVNLPSAIELIKNLDHLVYAGGPLEKSCGDTLSKYTKVSTIYGSTETGTVACLVPRPNYWQYLDFHPAWKPAMEPLEDGTFELVVHQDDEADQYRGIGGTIMRHQPQYRSKDLFVPHESVTGLWRFFGRRDDIIVFSNGEKWNPVPSEAMLLGHPQISGVLIVGNGRFQPAALIEPKKSSTSTPKALIEDIWPVAEKSNRQSQRHGRMLRSMITVVPAGSFIRAPKGTIVRAATTQKFSSIIDELYANQDSMRSNATGPALSQDQNLSDSIFELVHACAQMIEMLDDVSNDEDFFHSGLDSLRAKEFCGYLKNGLRVSYDEGGLDFVNPQLIFNHPTVNLLAKKTYEVLATGSKPEPVSDLQSQITTMVQKYSIKFQDTVKSPVNGYPPKHDGLHIVLTGSTGYLGQYLLYALLRSTAVSKVTCFDRNPAADKKCEKNMKPHKSQWEKVSFVTANFTEPDFGLTREKLNILDTCHAIIHCAWTVNFNHALTTFEPQISAASEIASRISKASTKPRLVFISSISTVGNFGATQNTRKGDVMVPEELIFDTSAPLPMGYGQSKYIVERILANAADKSGVPVSILRLGQIAGATSRDSDDDMCASQLSPWSKSEWFPSMILSAKNLGLLPTDLAPVDWIPVNAVAEIILELTLNDLASKAVCQVYTVANPNVTAWSSLLPAIECELNTPCEKVSFETWLSALKAQDGLEKSDIEKFPALKLWRYLQQRGAQRKRQQYHKEKAIKASPTLANLQAVDGRWLRQWMKQWEAD